MANTPAFTPATPGQLLPGQLLRSGPDEIASAIGLYDWLLGHYRTGVIYTQGWPDGAFIHSGARAVGPTFDVPIISDRHNTVRITIEYTVVGVAPMVTFTATSGAGVSSNPPAAGGPVEIVLPDLAIDTSFEWDSIAIEAETMIGSTVTVHRIRCEILPLANPLSAEEISGARPIGAGRGDADRTMSAHRLEVMVQGLPILRARPRVLWNQSGLGSIGADDLQEEIVHRQVARPWLESGATYTVRMYLRNATADALRAYLQVGDPRGFLNQRIPLDVPALSAGYRTATFELPEDRFVEEYDSEAAFVAIAINTTGAGHGRTAVDVLSIAIKGE